MVSLALRSPPSSSSWPSLVASLNSSSHRSLFRQDRHSRLSSSPNFVKCNLDDKYKMSTNGKPFVPIIDEQLPKLSDSKKLDNSINRRNRTRLKLFSGTANPALSKEIAHYMGLELGNIKIKQFADGELYVQLQESVRGCNVPRATYLSSCK